jgi:enamine deaminase RidA (YjgF/YER057c/UK114 family)
MEFFNPDRLPSPKGYNNGVRAGNLLFISGQPAYDREGKIVGDTLAEQFEVALGNVLEIVRAAGGGPENVTRMLIFVKNVQDYRGQQKELGAVWRKLMGKHFPAMSLVEVRDLVDPGAVVEIEATAVLP